jgi:hypothetical protein
VGRREEIVAGRESGVASEVLVKFLLFLFDLGGVGGSYFVMLHQNVQL